MSTTITAGDNHAAASASFLSDARAERLTELNVITGVRNLVKTSIIQHAWKVHNIPAVHGWVYRLTDGILHDLCKIDPGTGTGLESIYKLEEGL